MTYQIIYSSKSSTPMQSDDLEEILEQARRSNASKGITGALVYVDGVFLQIVEGEADVVQNLMGRISRDVRHETIAVLWEGQIPSAVFSDWNMAYVSATPQQVAIWAGLLGTTGTPDTLTHTPTDTPTDTLQDPTQQDPLKAAQVAASILAVLATQPSGRANAG